MTQKLTKEQAAIIGAYTGVLCGPFSDVHEMIEKAIGRPVWTHEMGNKDFMAEVKEKMFPQFLEIVYDEVNK